MAYRLYADGKLEKETFIWEEIVDFCCANRSIYKKFDIAVPTSVISSDWVTFKDHGNINIGTWSYSHKPYWFDDEESAKEETITNLQWWL